MLDSMPHCGWHIDHCAFGVPLWWCTGDAVSLSSSGQGNRLCGTSGPDPGLHLGKEGSVLAQWLPVEERTGVGKGAGLVSRSLSNRGARRLFTSSASNTLANEGPGYALRVQYTLAASPMWPKPSWTWQSRDKGCAHSSGTHAGSADRALSPVAGYTLHSPLGRLCEMRRRRAAATLLSQGHRDAAEACPGRATT